MHPFTKMDEYYEKSAMIAVREGVNVQPGDTVIVRASVTCYSFVRVLTKECYE